MTHSPSTQTAPRTSATSRKRFASVNPVSIAIVVIIHVIGAAVAAGLIAVGTIIAFAGDSGGASWLISAAWYTAIWGPGIVYVFGVAWTIVGMAIGRRGWLWALLTIAAMILVTALSFAAAFLGATG